MSDKLGRFIQTGEGVSEINIPSGNLWRYEEIAERQRQSKERDGDTNE